MAGEVTRKQQKLQIPAQDPPIFIQAGTPGREREKAKGGAGDRQGLRYQWIGKNVGTRSQEALFWTKAKRKSKLDQAKDG